MTPEPNEHDDDELDLILTRHFAGHLDGQLGRSGRAFEEHVRQTARWSRIVRWAVATAGGLAAAAVIALAFVPRSGDVAVKAPTTTVVQAPDAPAAADGEGALEQVVWSRTTDLGTVLLDGQTPARKILREQVREMTWTDAAGTRHVSATQPRQDVLLISLDTY